MFRPEDVERFEAETGGVLGSQVTIMAGEYASIKARFSFLDTEIEIRFTGDQGSQIDSLIASAKAEIKRRLPIMIDYHKSRAESLEKMLDAMGV